MVSVAESRQIMLDILAAIDKLCKDNGLTFYLAAGTLLGAVRHKGFIPWDDDIDILLLREDYDKLVKILKEQTEFPWLSAASTDDEGFYWPFCKAYDNRNIAQGIHLIDECAFFGIWVDVFPIDNFPDTEKERQKFMKRCHFYRSWIVAMRANFKTEKFGKKFLPKLFLSGLAHIVGKKRVVRWARDYMTRYNKQETKWVGSPCTTYPREYWEKVTMFPPTEVEFEGKKYHAFACWDAYLRSMYNDYMQLPPEEKRHAHNVTAYWKPGMEPKENEEA